MCVAIAQRITNENTPQLSIAAAVAGGGKGMAIELTLNMNST